jgi:hypothetical protein
VRTEVDPFGTALTLLRLTLGLDQSRVARACRCTTAAVSLTEGGLRRSPALVGKMLRFYAREFARLGPGELAARLQRDDSHALATTTAALQDALGQERAS